jgi:hypothetical protein
MKKSLVIVGAGMADSSVINGDQLDLRCWSRI